MKNLLSIVIPTKNRYEQLEISLGFLSKMDKINEIDIIIFDNSDKDYKGLARSKKLFSKIIYFLNHYNIKIFEEENLSMTENY